MVSDAIFFKEKGEGKKTNHAQKSTVMRTKTGIVPVSKRGGGGKRMPGVYKLCAFFRGGGKKGCKRKRERLQKTHQKSS